MVLITPEGFPGTGANTWYQTLVELQVTNLQIRSSSGLEKMQIDVAGTEARPIYRVTGMLTKSNELQVPGARFKTQQKAALGEWLAKLRDEGPERARGEERQAFGLRPEVLERVYTDLARPVDFSTEELDCRALLERLAVKLSYSLVAQPETSTLIAGGGSPGLELRGVSAGTALACMLRTRGLVLVPRLDGQRRPEYLVTPAAKGVESWPVGWLPKKLDREVLPGLFEVLDVEIEDISLAELLDVLEERLKATMLDDDAAIMAQHIDLDKVRITLPAKQSMVAIVLRKALFQAKLKYELRVDEAERPFLWITTVNPTPSPRKP